MCSCGIGQEENWNHIKYQNVEKAAAILTLCDISISDNKYQVFYFTYSFLFTQIIKLHFFMSEIPFV